MNNANFPEELCVFIQDVIPAVEAVELLLFLTQHSNMPLMLSDILRELKSTQLTDVAAKKYLALFIAHGLVADKENGFQYHPSSPELEAAVQALIKAYNERPVTLIRIIYAQKERKIQSFADAFKIKKD